MELQPKLVAAADMCEAGEEVNLDELAFLLRYASDELGGMGVFGRWNVGPWCAATQKLRHDIGL